VVRAAGAAAQSKERWAAEMKMRSTLLCLLLIVWACADPYEPSAVLGTADPARGDGTVRSLSASFSKAELGQLYERLNGSAFHERLSQYTCGDPVPQIVFTVSIFKRAEYQERHVLVQPRSNPSPSGRERCLVFGLGYEIDRAMADLDKGEPINDHYRDPLTGKELPSSTYDREVPRKPSCDCSKRDLGGEWVTWPS